MEKLEKMKSMGENGLIGLDEMAARVDNAVTTVVLIVRAEYLYDPVILNSLVSKLNIFLNLLGEYVGRLGDGPVSLERFNNWLQDKVEAIGNAGAWETSESNSQTQTKEEVQEARIPALKEQVKPSHSLLARKCLKCNVPSHVLKDCRNFAQMKNDDRLQWARERDICLGCLQQGHWGYACKAKVLCGMCKKPHNTLLHPKSTQTVGSHQEAVGSEGKDENGDAGEEATSENNATTAVNIVKRNLAVVAYASADSSEDGVSPGAEGTSCKCGWANRVSGSRIMGGRFYNKNEYPFLVSLVKVNGTKYTALCGGAIITPNHVITAAHCLNKIIKFRLKAAVFLGAHDRREVKTTAVYVHVAHFQQHAGYIPLKRDDIAILTLASSINFNKIIGPVCMPHPGLDVSGKTVRILVPMT
ncbi:hypothetical protein GE061_010068 [Apolygus lucorum]|uniref:Peptidase S1 domain-containing protein n=1 Tax=Apolygus lucorum TaxID=248454 RepID=A0A8S9Y4P6_APOLU|nr:hypothetical protein GE061_010068 [Apolygus lucorum]